MAYVQMTKDFSQVKKTIPGTGFTKRQLIAGLTGLTVGIPTFILLYGILKIDATVSAMGVVVAVLPFAFYSKKITWDLKSGFSSFMKPIL